MRKRIFGFSVILLFMMVRLGAQPMAAAGADVQPLSGILTARGKLIVDGNERSVILRGMGLGGWMLQESYMFRLSGLGPQFRIRQKIADLVGEQQAARFYDGWLKNHTTKADIDSLAAWGFNSIRLPMHYRLYTLSVDEEPVAGKNTWLQKGFELTDSLLAWCRADHLYLILDLHAAPGGQGNDLNISDRDPDKPSLWQSSACREKTVALWRKLAQRYAGDPAIGGYDILNEPNWGFEDPKDIRGTRETGNQPLRQLMMEISAAIREVDPAHLIIIEGNGFGNNYNGIFPLWDSNMVVSFHKYGNFNTAASIRKYLDLQDKYQMPLWLGESGENSNTWFTEAIGLVESYNIGWCWWQQKKMGINNPLEIRASPSYQMLLDYWLKNGRKPGAEEARVALKEWLENIRIGRNVYHKDVTDAMFRQVGSVSTLPFVPHRIGNGASIKAVDYDLGRCGYAYQDNDTARYQYASPPQPSAGNRGWMYRNDGVDIAAGDAGDYYVFDTEDGEWLQYTVDVVEPGVYTLVFTMATGSDSSRFTVMCDGRPLAAPVAVGNTGGPASWRNFEIKNIRLRKGECRLRVVVEKGGFNFSRMEFRR
ncbi:cellulase family glycosylhydrolase [Puia sp.]|uniref:cellulase family glycosylhydrolase n=1 Tax=Puia sp. TaxID=2045100 RepID=UPI002F41B0C5